MTELTFGADRLRVDVAATRAYYGAHGEIAGGCGCAACRNFAAAVGEVPQAVGAVLARLGLDIRMPVEVCEWGEEADGLIWYSAWYHLVGSLPAVGSEDTVLAQHCRMSFQRECFVLQEDLPSPHFQLNLELRLPWVLPEPYPQQAGAGAVSGDESDCQSISDKQNPMTGE